LIPRSETLQQPYMGDGRNRPAIVVKFSDSFFRAVELFRSETCSGLLPESNCKFQIQLSSSSDTQT
jgi:hypothetical protein